MGIHTVHIDCVKCGREDSLVNTYDTRNPFASDAFCLSCGCNYIVIEKKLTTRELTELRKDYEWGD
jgi:hypothetical protein